MQPCSSDGLGAPLPDWQPPPRPFADREGARRATAASESAPGGGSEASATRAAPLLAGRFCSLVPLRPGHAEALYAVLTLPAASSTTSVEDVWKYLPVGPFDSSEALRAWIADAACNSDNIFMAVLDGPEPAVAKPVGFVSYLRIHPRDGSIETGFITLSPTLQRTRIATEVHYLMMQHAFSLGYRRYEWKCNACNLPSRRAAQRLGFAFEGISRQATVVKGRNRDTAWFSIIDSEWPALQSAFESYLVDDNFDEAGKQIVALSSLTRPLLTMLDPSLQSAPC